MDSVVAEEDLGELVELEFLSTTVGKIAFFLLSSSLIISPPKISTFSMFVNSTTFFPLNNTDSTFFSPNNINISSAMLKIFVLSLLFFPPIIPFP